jgi:3'-phosphoadenosine 5'-phosphosulfate sulfotransferase (PAPS reductase)/FAD synthetase
MQYIDETLLELNKARERLDSIVVAYSGGKDSLAVMDLCVRTFSKVEAFIMEFVPGLELYEESLAFAKSRWGITVRRYLHWSAIQAMRAGMYCDTHWKKELPKASLATIQELVRRETGIAWIADGQKRSDGANRASLMAFAKTRGDKILRPIAGWSKDHVIGYLKIHGIPLPSSSGTAMSGVGLKVNDILWLHDQHPRDFARLLKLFPHAEAVVWRRKFFGLPKTKDRHGKPAS